MNGRTYAYLIKDALRISIPDLIKYIDQIGGSMNIKPVQFTDMYAKVYVNDKTDIFTALSEYIDTKIMDEQANDVGDMKYAKEIICDNLDIFFDVSPINENMYTIEIVDE